MLAFAETVGMIGSAMLIIAYFLLQSGKVKGNSFVYLYMNLFAALFILLSLFYVPNRPSIVIEFFWVGISLYGLWKRKRKTNVT